MKYIKYLVLFAMVFIGSYLIYENSLKKNKENDKVENNLAKINDLMVIAHPGDEIIWASQQIKKANTYIICVACGTDEETDNVFIELSKKYQNRYKFLNLSITEDGEYDDWINSYDYIEKEIDTILKTKHWDNVFTYSPESIVNDSHYKLISRITTESAIRQRLSNNLHYFAPVYTEEEILVENNQLKEEKEEILSSYVSLTDKIEGLRYLLHLEKIVKYQ